MQLRLLSWLILCAAFAAIPMRAQVPAAGASLTLPGTVIVAKVSGTANMTVNGTTTQLKVDDPVPQAAKIVTQLNSSVVLAFSNGATTQLGPDTEFIMEEFLQDPFASTITVANLVEEPTASRTKLTLNRGEIVGNVKKLKHANGSSFTVQTPVGAAGIRGTTFRIVFRPTGTGQAFGAQGGQNFQFQLSTLEGDVGFQQGAAGGPGSGAGAPGGGNQGTGNGNPGDGGTTTTSTTSVQGVSVPTGQEIVVTVTATQNAQGQLVIVAPPTVTSTIAINPNAAAAFAAAAQEIIASTANATFTPPAAPGGGGQSQGSTNVGTTGSSGNPPSTPFTNTNTTTTSPPATQTPPRLTPGS
jgi:hypothetical protein